MLLEAHFKKAKNAPNLASAIPHLDSVRSLLECVYCMKWEHPK